MIALWMVYAVAVAAAVGAAAAILDRAAAGTLNQRRWIWVGALLLSTAIPVGTALSGRGAPPDVASPAPVQPRGGLVARIDAAIVANRVAQLLERAEPQVLARFDSQLVTGWIVLALLAFGAYGVASWSLASRRRTWRATRVDGHDVLLAKTVGPAVVGTLSPRIVVPEWSLDLPREQRALMLEHEREHVRARDPLLLHGAALLTLLAPWNVAAWWLNRRLRLAVELDCDARVLAAGRDARAYGSLLLDVCSRRTRGAPVLAPALLERTSSLTRRILAMHPARSRFPRARGALGAAGALVVVALACEMPSPEMLAPDGKDVASTRVFGKIAGADDPTDMRGLVSRHFPEVARGEGGPAILYVVEAASAGVVFTEAQPATALTKTPASAREADRRATTEAGLEAKVRTQPLKQSPAATTEIRMVEVPRESRTVGRLRMKSRSPGAGTEIPTGIGAIRQDDIESIDVSKYAAGNVAPNAISIIYIKLKPGAVIPWQR